MSAANSAENTWIFLRRNIRRCRCACAGTAFTARLAHGLLRYFPPPAADPRCGGAGRLHRPATPPSWRRRASTNIPARAPAITPRSCSGAGIPGGRRRVALAHLSARARHGRRTGRGRAAPAARRRSAGAGRGACAHSCSAVFDRYPVPPALGAQTWSELRAELDAPLEADRPASAEVGEGHPRAVLASAISI